MDASKYRQVMTDLFWHGAEPDFESEKSSTGEPKKRPRATTKKSKIEELRAFNEAIAARNRPKE